MPLIDAYSDRPRLAAAAGADPPPALSLFLAGHVPERHPDRDRPQDPRAAAASGRASTPTRRRGESIEPRSPGSSRCCGSAIAAWLAARAAGGLPFSGAGAGRGGAGGGGAGGGVRRAPRGAVGATHRAGEPAVAALHLPAARHRAVRAPAARARSGERARVGPPRSSVRVPDAHTAGRGDRREGVPPGEARGAGPRLARHASTCRRSWWCRPRCSTRWCRGPRPGRPPPRTPNARMAEIQSMPLPDELRVGGARSARTRRCARRGARGALLGRGRGRGAAPRSPASSTRCWAPGPTPRCGTRCDGCGPRPSARAPRPIAGSGRDVGAAGAAARPARMAVIVQRWWTPRRPAWRSRSIPCSGDRHTAVVSAVYGLGEGLVSGELDADTYHVRFEGGEARAVTSVIAAKTARGGARSGRRHATRAAAGGGARAAGALGRRGPAHRHLRPASRRRVRRAPGRGVGAVRHGRIPARSARLWCSRRGRSRRSRPRRRQRRPRLGERRVWDNSNIVESYSGVTTPLTFSFARARLREVYRQFCGSWACSEARDRGAPTTSSPTCSAWCADASTTTC